MAKERIGIMGGTFNPVHSGHIAMARAAAKQERLDTLLFLPTGNPPHKHEGLVCAEDRYRMMAAAVASEPLFTPSRLELDREGVIYTLDTLNALKETYPKADLFYIIGTDTLMELQNWHEFRQVLTLCTFLVCPRACRYSPQEVNAERKRLRELGGHFISIGMEPVNVSSTDVRAAFASGAKNAVPAQVAEYVRAAGLYGVVSPFAHGAEWLDKLWHALTLKRFSHTLAVADTARRLAKLHGVDPQKAECAGLLHDCAKCMPLKEMQALCTEPQAQLLLGADDTSADPSIRQSGALLHSVSGAILAHREYGLDDPDVLHAIACHTTGRVGMTPLDMVVYLADKIEPTRESYPTLDKVRFTAQLSLPRAMIHSMEGTTKYVKKGGKALHPTTQAVLEWLKSTTGDA